MFLIYKKITSCFYIFIFDLLISITGIKGMRERGIGREGKFLKLSKENT